MQVSRFTTKYTGASVEKTKKNKVMNGTVAAAEANIHEFLKLMCDEESMQDHLRKYFSHKG